MCGHTNDLFRFARTIFCLLYGLSPSFSKDKLCQYIWKICFLSLKRPPSFSMDDRLRFVMRSAHTAEVQRWACMQAAAASGEARPKDSRIVSQAFTALSSSRGDALVSLFYKFETGASGSFFNLRIADASTFITIYTMFLFGLRRQTCSGAMIKRSRHNMWM